MRPKILFNFFAILLVTTTTLTALGQQTNRVNDRQVEVLLKRLDNNVTGFRTEVDLVSDRNRRSRENDLTRSVAEFDKSIDWLFDKFRSRQITRIDVENTLNRGWEVDAYIQNRQPNTLNNVIIDNASRQKWRNIRSDMQLLARYYNVAWNWDNRTWAPSTNSNWQNSLTGTFSYDASRSDDPNRAVDQALRNVNRTEAERARAVLLRRVEAPSQIAIEQAGRSFTIASSNAPAVTLQADGRSISESRPNGRTTTRTTATLSRNILTISSMADRGGERSNDFQVTFEPFENGRSLRVTRNFYSDRFSQSVVTTSIYTRTSNVAQVNLYNDGYNRDRLDIPGRQGQFDRRQRSFNIPDGMQLTAILNNALDTQQAQDGDRFTLTVTSPGQYSGAVIEGYLVDATRSGRITGRAALNMEFQSIRMTNGGNYDFAAYIEEVRTKDGQKITVDNEGSVKDDKSQTERTVVRSGIGAALGAIIGGIAGGGKGAAIGAAVGAGAGAGSVIVQGRDDLKLQQGAEFIIRTSAPRLAAQ